MPELPEVETIKTDLKKALAGQKIIQTQVYDRRVLFQSSIKKFTGQIKGKTIIAVERRGKAIVFRLSKGWSLAVQLRMTGQLIYAKEDLKTHYNCKETKVTFKLSNGYFLNYNDQRIFGKFILSRNLDLVSYFKKLGVEPLGNAFSPDWLRREARRRRMPVKTFLLNQNIIAGIGNIYASEILFKAKIHPKRLASSLAPKEVSKIYSATKAILKEAIRLRGTSFRDYRDASGKKGNYLNRLKVYLREDKGCLICRTPVKRLVQGGRSTFYCSKCQKGN